MRGDRPRGHGDARGVRGPTSFSEPLTGTVACRAKRRCPASDVQRLRPWTAELTSPGVRTHMRSPPRIRHCDPSCAQFERLAIERDRDRDAARHADAFGAMRGPHTNGLAPEAPPALVPIDQRVALLGHRREELTAGRTRLPMCGWRAGGYPRVCDSVLEERRSKLRNIPCAVAEGVARLGLLELNGATVHVEEVDCAYTWPVLKQHRPRRCRSH